MGFLKIASFNTIDSSAIQLSLIWNRPTPEGVQIGVIGRDYTTEEFVEITNFYQLLPNEKREFVLPISIKANIVGELYLIIPHNTFFYNYHLTILQNDSCVNILGDINLYGSQVYKFNGKNWPINALETPVSDL
jgi:hypothetical protein